MTIIAALAVAFALLNTLADLALRRSATTMDEMTRDEMVQAGWMEGENYRDFPPPGEDDPEAYAEMCREQRLMPWDRQA